MRHQLTTKQKSLPYTLTNFLEDHGHLVDERTKKAFYNEMAFLISNAPEEPTEKPWPKSEMIEFKDADPKTVMDNLFTSIYKGIEYEGDSLSKVVSDLEDGQLFELAQLTKVLTDIMIFETGKCHTAYEALTGHALRLNRAVNAELVYRYQKAQKQATPTP